MARTTLYCSDTYLAGARGKLTLAEHREFKTADEAVRRAERDAVKGAAVGALAYSIEADHEFEDYGEPKVLARFGRTPEE